MKKEKFVEIRYETAKNGGNYSELTTRSRANNNNNNIPMKRWRFQQKPPPRQPLQLLPAPVPFWPDLETKHPT
jgi:hypothetical protein